LKKGLAVKGLINPFDFTQFISFIVEQLFCSCFILSESLDGKRNLYRTEEAQDAI